MVDLQSEQLLKTFEVLLKTINLKVIFTNLLPNLYLKKLTTSMRFILSGLTKNKSQGKNQCSDSFLSETETRDEDEYLSKAFNAFELHDNLKFELSSLSLTLNSYS